MEDNNEKSLHFIENYDIINARERKIKSDRYPVTQQQIDDILENELKEYIFPVKPVYNSRIRANGITRGTIYKWGQFKRIISIEIGKQDNSDRKFLIDTLLHEYFEADIMIKQNTDSFYKKLSESGDIVRHKWINSQIDKFFEKLEGSK